MLLSFCIEQTGLNPVVVLKKGHARVGCWLTGFARHVGLFIPAPDA